MRLLGDTIYRPSLSVYGWIESRMTVLLNNAGICWSNAGTGCHDCLVFSAGMGSSKLGTWFGS